MSASYRHLKSMRGFTLVELVVAISISAVFLAVVVNTFSYYIKTGAEENLKGKLRIDMQKAMERMKQDAHLTNGNGLVFYPANAASFTAMSLPQATPDQNGLLAFTSGSISWDRTVIYHLFPNGGKTELRRTVFDSYDANAVNRQTQLDNVVAAGDGRNGPGGSYTTTTVFSEDSVALTINPQYSIFDGYAPATTRSASTSFGSLVLSAGMHNVSFIVTGKNDLSSGYALGLDSVTLSPSGGEREAEALLPASASSGRTIVAEDMSAMTGGVWGGNYQVEYQASANNDFITLQAYYDMWVESNFDKVTRANTAVYGTNPALSLASREDQCLSPAWLAQTQTTDTTGGQDYISSQAETIRCIVSGSQIQRAGNMMRIKFKAGDGGSLTINEAYFGVRSSGSGNFASVPVQLYFDNTPVAEGSKDPVGAIANPGSQSGITIPAGNHCWTNWFTYNCAAPSSNDYLISYFVSSGTNATAWTDSLAMTQSYIVGGNHASDLTLSAPVADTRLIGSEWLGTWVSAGIAISQIYDTKITAPVFNQIAWTPVLPAGASVTMSVRSSSNADMSGASVWSAGAAASPAALAAGQRYVQWLALFEAGSNVAATYPRIDNVTIDWPGQMQLVEVSGVYTQRPDYGTFKVQVDGLDPVKALEFQISSSTDVQGRTLNLTLKSEENPANTGK